MFHYTNNPRKWQFGSPRSASVWGGGPPAQIWREKKDVLLIFEIDAFLPRESDLTDKHMVFTITDT